MRLKSRQNTPNQLMNMTSGHTDEDAEEPQKEQEGHENQENQEDQEEEQDSEPDTGYTGNNNKTIQMIRSCLFRSTKLTKIGNAL